MNIQELSQLAAVINQTKTAINTTGYSRVDKTYLNKLRSKVADLEQQFIEGVLELEERVSPSDIQKKIAAAKSELAQKSPTAAVVTVDEHGNTVILAKEIKLDAPAVTVTQASPTSEAAPISIPTVFSTDENKVVTASPPADPPEENILAKRLAEERKKVASRKRAK